MEAVDLLGSLRYLLPDSVGNLSSKNTVISQCIMKTTKIDHRNHSADLISAIRHRSMPASHIPNYNRAGWHHHPLRGQLGCSLLTANEVVLKQFFFLPRGGNDRVNDQMRTGPDLGASVFQCEVDQRDVDYKFGHG